MAYVTFTAANDYIQSGNSAGDSLSILFDADAINLSDQVDRDVYPSISGKEEVIYHRNDVMWQINAIGIHKNDLDAWREFYHSVKTGQSFTLDPYALTLTADDPRTVTIQTDSFVPVREATSDYFSIAFTVKEYV